MIPRRRLVMQLTSLLDLMLIITFGQHMVARHQRAVESEQGQAAIRETAELQRQLAEATSQATISQLELAQRAVMLQQSHADLERTLEQQRRVGELLVELFQLPTDAVAQLVDPSRSPVGSLTATDAARLKSQVDQMARNDPGAMIEHLLTYDEIRKRCDIWEVYVDSSNVAEIDLGQEIARVRIPADASGNVDATAFEADLYARYKGLPQPKTLVIMLLTYDRGTKISTAQSLRQVLPRLVARMQADSTGRSRFEYADLGFKIK